MALLNRIARAATRPVPRFISPRAHATLDYLMVGSFLAASLWFRPRSPRASLAALACGGAQLALNLLTDYGGTSGKPVHFSTHRRMDTALAAITATMPETISLQGDDARAFFRAEGVMFTVLGELTRSRTGNARSMKRPFRAA